MSMHDQFLEGLLQTPDDRTLRRVYADWCEDNDQPDCAECLRWMASANKRPFRGSTNTVTWFNAETIAPEQGDEESDLPDAVFRMLEGGLEVAHHRAFASLTEAERAIQGAWVKARKVGWAPGD